MIGAMKKIQINPFPSTLMESKKQFGKAAFSSQLLNQKGIGFGDFLVIKGTKGPVTLEVIKANKEDLILHGKDRMFLATSTASLVDDNIGFIKPFMFLLGADPEFFLAINIGKTWKNSHILEGANYLPSKYADGPWGEIRPFPSNSVEGLIKNIEKELLEIYKLIRMPKMEMYGTSYLGGLAAGFHLHFNMPQEVLCLAEIDEGSIINTLVSILDSSVGLLSRKDPESKSRMKDCMKYGRLGDFKLNLRTLEYRVPGASWLRSEESAHILLEYGYNIFKKALITTKILSNDWRNPVREELVRQFFDLPNTKETTRLYYSDYSDEIEKKLLRKKLHLTENPSIIKGWGLNEKNQSNFCNRHERLSSDRR